MPAVLGRHPVDTQGVPRLNPGSCLSIWIRFILFIIFYDFTPLRRGKGLTLSPATHVASGTRIIRKNLFPRGEIITPSRTFTPSVVSFRRQIRILYGPVGWKFDFHLVPVPPIRIPFSLYYPFLTIVCSHIYAFLLSNRCTYFRWYYIISFFTNEYMIEI